MTEEHVKITHMDDGCTVQLAMCVKGISSRVAGAFLGFSAVVVCGWATRCSNSP
jgi:hypothetical protein